MKKKKLIKRKSKCFQDGRNFRKEYDLNKSDRFYKYIPRNKKINNYGY